MPLRGFVSAVWSDVLMLPTSEWMTATDVEERAAPLTAFTSLPTYKVPFTSNSKSATSGKHR
jgi:hypothetical protein